MLDNENLFLIDSNRKLRFMLLKLDWEKESFQVKCELVENPITYGCDLPILRRNNRLVVNLSNWDENKYYLFKFDFNAYKLEKCREISISSMDALCYGFFEDKMLFFESNYLANSSITLCCLDLKDEKLSKFDTKLPYKMDEVDFIIALIRFNV